MSKAKLEVQITAVATRLKKELSGALASLKGIQIQSAATGQALNKALSRRFPGMVTMLNSIAQAAVKAKGKFIELEKAAGLKGVRSAIQGTLGGIGAVAKRATSGLGGIGAAAKRATAGLGSIGAAAGQRAAAGLGKMGGIAKGALVHLRTGVVKGIAAGLGSIGAAAATALGPLVAIGAAIAGLAKLVSLGAGFEKSAYQMGALINATVQFRDELGKPLNFQDNLKASLSQSKALLNEFANDAAGLVGVTNDQLQLTAKFALPKLGELGIVDIKEQAKTIEDITVSLNQLNLAFSEAQIRQESLALLEGNVTDARATFASLVAQVNGGSDAFKRNFEEAKKAGTAYEFIRDAIKSFRQSSEFAADTLDNTFSIAKDVATRLGQAIGVELNDPMKNLLQSGIKPLIDENGRLRDSVIEVATSIGQNLGKGIEALSPLISAAGKLFAAFGRLSAAAFGEVLDAGSGFIDFLAKTTTYIASFVDGVAISLKGVVGIVKQSVILVQKAFNVLVDSVSAGVIGLFNYVNRTINGAIKGVLNTINGLISGINSSLGQSIKPITLSVEIPAINNKFASSLTKSIDATKGSFNKIKGSWNEIFEGTVPTVASKDTFDVSKYTPTSKVAKVGAGAQSGRVSGRGGIGGGVSGVSGGGAQSANSEQKQLESLKQSNLLKSQELTIEKELSGLRQRTESLTTANQLVQQQLVAKQQELENEKQLIEQKIKSNEISREEGNASKLAIEQKLGEVETQRKLVALAIQRNDLSQESKQIELERQQSILQTVQPLQQQLIKLQESHASQDLIKQKTEEIGLAQEALNLKFTEASHSISLANEKLAGQEAQIYRNSAAAAQMKTTQDNINTSCNKTNESFESLQQAAQGVGSALSNSLKKAIETGEFDIKEFAGSLLDTVGNLANSLASSLLGSLGGGLGGGFGGGGGGGLGNLVGSLFGGIGGFSRGGIVPQYFASGGLAKGRDTVPAMLTPGEMVLNKGQQQNLFNMLQSGGGQQMNITYNIQALDGADVERVLSQPGAQKVISGHAVRATQQNSTRSFNNGPFQKVKGGR